ncbi:hypothetical protein [Rhodoferax sp. GW822-FHT02A01]|uniref:hypothetical protein n=1 Tax=Rhodoferax sp. GW822-FHT02A01 TaxID=3141537 RepID=UPI00315C5912
MNDLVACIFTIARSDWEQHGRHVGRNIAYLIFDAFMHQLGDIYIFFSTLEVAYQEVFNYLKLNVSG